MTAPAAPEEFDWYQHPSQYPHLNPVRQMLTAAGWEEGQAKLADEDDGSYHEVHALLADHNWRTELTIANTMGLVGEWGTDDVSEAVTNALHEYRDLRAQRIALLAVQADLLKAETVGVLRLDMIRRLHEVLTNTDPYPDGAP